MSETINPVHTSCKKCVFAEYNSITQTGCKLNYLDKYTKLTNVIEVYDDDLEFFVINDKKCIGYRENSWFTQFGLANASIQEKLDKYYELNHLDYMMTINIDSIIPNDRKLTTLSEHIANLKIKPKKIIFVRYTMNALIHNYAAIQHFLITAGLNNCQWRIQTMEDNKANYLQTLHQIINANKNQRFILSTQLLDTYNLCDIIDRANKIVYHDLDRFYIISNSDKTSLLFSGALYRFSLAADQKNILDDETQYMKI